MKYHPDYEILAFHAAELGCDRIILTHMSAEILSRLPDLNAEGASDGLEVTL
jgi:hypothetical protein